MGNKLKLKGQIFGRLTVVLEDPIRDNHKKVKWICECSCGSLISVRGSDLKSKKIFSCGCYMIDRIKEVNTKHGLCTHPLYWVHSGMKQRCSNSNENNYQYYGARGIKVCEEWINNPEAFIAWGMINGYKPGLEIDRIDNDSNYEPSNCRFVTPKVNSNNRRVRKVGKSGYTGIYIGRENKWQSKLTFERYDYDLGLYTTKKDALKARNEYIVLKGFPHPIQKYRGE